MTSQRGLTLLCLALAATAAGGCEPGEPGPPVPPLEAALALSRDAKPASVEMMRKDVAAVRHVSDGGGRFWVESIEDADGAPLVPRARQPARIRLVYEAGPHGVGRGGALVLQISPFWGWDPPQNIDPEKPGFTDVTTQVPGVVTTVRTLPSHRLRIDLPARGLLAGERIELLYGAGPALARVDRYAEREARLWIGVDGNGDGVREFVAEPATLDIAAGPPARLHLVLPSSARPGERVPLRVSVLDAGGNTGVDFAGEVQLSGPEGLELPDGVRFDAVHRGRRQIEVGVLAAGVFRVTAGATLESGQQLLPGASNPLRVHPDAPAIHWADLHGHSLLSDGTGPPVDYFLYARDVAGLDVVALTDHDHWGLTYLDGDPALWEEIREQTRRFHTPGFFVTLLGYEWTSWLHGHRHVLYFGDDGEVFSYLDPRFETPTQLWDALRGSSALTFAHHSAGGPISTNWNYVPDPELEPVTEIVSSHGSSEAADAPTPVYDPVEGNFVRDVLDRGQRFGFIGSGDTHNGHPGAAYIDSPQGGGLAAIVGAELTRESIRAALSERRVYATNGPRILLDVSVDGVGMGGVVMPRDGDEAPFRLRVVAEQPLARIDLVRSGAVESIPLEGELEATLDRMIPALRADEYFYVRVLQQNGGAAWSSPIYADATSPPVTMR